MKQALWKAYCSFSKKERQGIIALLIVISICWITPALWERFMPVDESLEQDSLLLAEVTAFREALAQQESKTRADTGNVRIRRFRFDPNTITREAWAALGVKERTINIIQRYIEKGGRFRKPADLQRIYGMPPALCNELMPYVSIAGGGLTSKDTTGRLQRAPFPQHVPGAGRWVKTVNINTADSSLWESLPGIGPVLAARIVKFRDRLGGFYAISQVKETFGLPDSTFNKIQAYLRLYEVSLKKVDINEMDEKTLAQHPYIRYKLARLIVLYRSNHGPFRRPEDLLGIPLVDDSIYRKIEHYIKTENSPL